MSDRTASVAAVEPHRPALVVAAVLLGASLQINDGLYHPGAVALVAASLACVWAALLWPAALHALIPDRDGVVAGLLFLGAQAQLVVLMRAPLGMYFRHPLPVDQSGTVPALMLASVLLGAIAMARGRARAAAATALLLVALMLGLQTYRESPAPHIDVVTVHDAAFAALGRGESPYSIRFPDIYEGRQAFYPPGMATGGLVDYGFPYPPLSLAMTWPGHLLGDFRLSELAAWIGAAAVTMAAGGNSAIAALAAGLVLFTPRAFFGLEQAWTDPLAALWLVAAVWAACRGRSTLAATLVGLGAATKQHVAVVVPLVILLGPGDWRARTRLVAVALMAAGAALLPALGDPAGFLRSAVMVQIREALRYDALSLAVPYATWTGAPLPGIVYAAVVLGAVGLATWRAPRTPAGFATAIAVVLFTAFAIGKKAFCNYYLFVLVVLGVAIAVRRQPLTDSSPEMYT